MKNAGTCFLQGGVTGGQVPCHIPAQLCFVFACTIGFLPQDSGIAQKYAQNTSRLVPARTITWILPVLIFGRGEKVPAYILYLGKVVPYTAMGLLIIYCLKDVPVLESPHAIPEFLALALVSLTYLWKRNTILSVVAGMVVYMALVQMVF